jgi:hypothetical protein
VPGLGTGLNDLTSEVPGLGTGLNPFSLSSSTGLGPLKANANLGLFQIPISASFLNPSATADQTYNPTVTQNPYQSGIFNNNLDISAIGGPYNSATASLFGSGKSNSGGAGGGGGNISGINYNPTNILSSNLPAPLQMPAQQMANLGSVNSNPLSHMMPMPPSQAGMMMPTTQPIAAGGVSPVLAGMMAVPQQQQLSQGQPVIPGTASQAGGYDMPAPPPMPMGGANAMGIPNMGGGMMRPQMAPSAAPGNIMTAGGNQIPFNQVTARGPSKAQGAVLPDGSVLTPPPPTYQPSLADFGKPGSYPGFNAQPAAAPIDNPQDYRDAANQIINGLDANKQTEAQKIKAQYKALDAAIDTKRKELEEGTPQKPSKLAELNKQLNTLNNKMAAALGIGLTEGEKSGDTPEQKELKAEQSAMRQFLTLYPGQEGLQRLNAVRHPQEALRAIQAATNVAVRQLLSPHASPNSRRLATLPYMDLKQQEGQQASMLEQQIAADRNFLKEAKDKALSAETAKPKADMSAMNIVHDNLTADRNAEQSRIDKLVHQAKLENWGNYKVDIETLRDRAAKNIQLSDSAGGAQGRAFGQAATGYRINENTAIIVGREAREADKQAKTLPGQIAGRQIGNDAQLAQAIKTASDQSLPTAPLKLQWAQTQGQIPKQYTIDKLKQAYDLLQAGKATPEQFAARGIDVKTLKEIFKWQTH